MEFETVSQASDSRCPLNEADWHTLRPQFEQLYKVEGKTRQEICNTLLRNYCVTENIFKQRVAKWKLDKKLKRSEMVFAVKRIKQRKNVGKSTRIVIRGEEIARKKIDCYFRRRPLTVVERYRQQNAPTPPDLECTTPGAHPDPSFGNDIDLNEVHICHGAVAGDDIDLSGVMMTNVQAFTTSPFHKIESEPILPMFMFDEPQIMSTPLMFQLSPYEDALRSVYAFYHFTGTSNVRYHDRRITFNDLFKDIVVASNLCNLPGRPRVRRFETPENNGRGRYTARRVLLAPIPDLACLVQIIRARVTLSSNLRVSMKIMNDLYDIVCKHLGAFNPLIEVVCNLSRLEMDEGAKAFLYAEITRMLPTIKRVSRLMEHFDVISRNSPVRVLWLPKLD